MAVVIASAWARHDRPELALSLAIITFAGFLLFAVLSVARLARLPGCTADLLLRTGTSIGFSVVLLAVALFARWIPTLVVVLILLAIFVVQRRFQPAVTASQAP